MFIDTHNHIAGPEFDADRDSVLQRAKAAGVSQMLIIGTDLPSSQKAVALAEQHPFLWATVGLHPHESGQASHETLQALNLLSCHPKVVAWGEMGLDYYYQHASPEDQRQAFMAQIRLAKSRRLPLVIHSREAWDPLFEILEQEGLRPYAREVGIVFHCFTGDKNVAQRAVDFGAHLSFSGIVTFPKAVAVQEAAAAIPLDKMLIETDAPYLSPQGFRGKRNEPAYVRGIAEKIAELRACPAENVAKETSQNAIRLFRLDR